jgi:hypothetical protein
MEKDRLRIRDVSSYEGLTQNPGPGIPRSCG